LISQLRIENFKSLRRLEIKTRRLTVLTGINGGGKSSVIQSLLLARQAALDPAAAVVRLNGPNELHLGYASDVLNFETDPGAPQIAVTIDDDLGTHAYRFGVPQEQALYLNVERRPGTQPARLIGRGPGFAYLRAERWGPRDQLSVSPQPSDRINVGPSGEFTAQVLALHERDKVPDLLQHPADPDETQRVVTLRTQVERWCSSIVRPIRIIAEWPPNLTASVIRFAEPGAYGQTIRPDNMGFGVSYALPIIVACMMAPEAGGLLIVENPEAHLHPAGQSRLGRLLARVAGAGTQVLVETHSDHVLNGTRLAVAEDRVLAAQDAIVHFFGGSGTCDSLDLTPQGGLSRWPDGFFDQTEHDLGRLARVRRAQQ